MSLERIAGELEAIATGLKTGMAIYSLDDALGVLDAELRRNLARHKFSTATSGRGTFVDDTWFVITNVDDGMLVVSVTEKDSGREVWGDSFPPRTTIRQISDQVARVLRPEKRTWLSE